MCKNCDSLIAKSFKPIHVFSFFPNSFSQNKKIEKTIVLEPGFNPDNSLIYKKEGNQKPGFDNCTFISGFDFEIN